MMTFLPDATVVAAFTAAAVILILTPGPDMTLFVGETLRAGRSRGFAAMLGASAGLIVHTTLAALGLSALLATSTVAFTVLKIAGVAYLLWLALQAIRHGSALTVSTAPTVKRSIPRTFVYGVAINLLNPKIVMFFLTFLPQFVHVGDPHASGKLLFLGFYFIALGLPICAVLITLAERFTARMQRSPRIMRAVDWTFAGLMGAFAARLLFARGNP
jgi:threonine/homoserine/homoserine lactone efflux protein